MVLAERDKMFLIDLMNKAKAADSERRCSECENANPQSIPGKEVVIDKGTIWDAVWAIFRFFTAMDMRLARQEKNISKALKAGENYSATLERCFDTVSDCQKQTADLANQALERHLLYPSILAVDLLSSTLHQLTQQAEVVSQCFLLNSQVMSLAESIANASEIAESKKAALDMQSIQPSELDELDKDMHTIISVVDTDDRSKHKKIHSTLSAGLLYHGKVLREAKVSVYRFSSKVVKQNDEQLTSEQESEANHEKSNC